MPVDPSDPNAGIPSILRDRFTPGLEGGLGALAQVLGAYESARGAPAGVALQALGGLGSQNAANRQAWKAGQANNAARLNMLAGEGLIPQNLLQGGPGSESEGFYKNLRAMSPDAEDKEIGEIAGIEANRQAVERTENKPKIITNKANGKAYYVWPDGRQPVEVPELSGLAPAKNANEQFLREHANDADPAKSLAQWQNQNKLDEYRKQQDYAYAKRLQYMGPLTKARVGATWDALQSQDPRHVPGFSNMLYFNSQTHARVQPKSLGDVLNPDNHIVGIDRASARTILPAVEDCQAILSDMAQRADRLLKSVPKGKAGFISGLKLTGQALDITYLANTGNEDARQYLADRQELTANLQRLFTGSTRQMNITEFNSILGREAPKKEGLVGSLPSADIQSVLPDRFSSKEEAKAATQNIQKMIDKQFELNDLAPEKSADAYYKIIDSTPPDVVGAGLSPDASTPSEPESAPSPTDEDSVTF